MVVICQTRAEGGLNATGFRASNTDTDRVLFTKLSKVGGVCFPNLIIQELAGIDFLLECHLDAGNPPETCQLP